MNDRSSSRAALTLLLGLWLGAIALGAGAIPPIASDSYEARVAGAKALAAEKSWAKAQEAYAAALALAPDAEAKRWCELGRVDAGWRARPEPAQWPDIESARAERSADYDVMLRPYAEGRPKDALWVAIMKSRARDGWRSYGGTGNNDMVSVAMFYAEQAPTPENAAAFLGFMAEVLGGKWNGEPFIGLLDTAIRLAPAGESRAWFAMRRAELANFEARPRRVPDSEKHWAEAVALACGTKWEPVVKAKAFAEHSRLAISRLPKREGTDVPRLLAEIRHHLESLRKAAEVSQGDWILGYIEKMEATWCTPRLTLEVPEVNRPGAPVGVFVGTAWMGNCRLEVRQSELDDMVRACASAFGERRGWKATEPTGRLVHEQALSCTSDGNWSGSEVMLPAMAPGHYTVTLKGDHTNETRVETKDLIVTGIAGVLHGDNQLAA
ncbi:MAG: hypothetical protein IPL39_04800 [Opitutaceae bacterium]|nr:hypothetical protein [Opitutaceae bacterium]